MVIDMEEKSSKTNPIGSSLVGFLGSVIIDNLGAWEFLSERVKEPTKTFILFILSFVVIFVLSNQFQKIILQKFPRFKEFLCKYKKKIIPIVLVFSCVLFAIVMADKAFKTSDSVIPTVMVSSPESNVVASSQFNTPVVYHVVFDDETKLKEVNFTADSVNFDDFTAEININKVSDTEYVFSLTNIIGDSGAHRITLKDGIAKDYANNKSKSVELKPFYLYNKESDIDKDAPEINFTRFNSEKEGSVLFNVNITDNDELLSTRLNEEDIILIGFTADIEIERDIHNYSVKLTNVKKTNENCFVVIAAGVATDSWNNSSEYAINSIDI